MDNVINLDFCPSFQDIKDFFGPMDESEKTFNSSGRIFTAQRKFTYKGSTKGLFEVRTNYLHIYYKGLHYKETKDGSFLLV